MSPTVPTLRPRLHPPQCVEPFLLLLLRYLHLPPRVPVPARDPGGRDRPADGRGNAGGGGAETHERLDRRAGAPESPHLPPGRSSPPPPRSPGCSFPPPAPPCTSYGSRRERRSPCSPPPRSRTSPRPPPRTGARRRSGSSGSPSSCPSPWAAGSGSGSSARRTTPACSPPRSAWRSWPPSSPSAMREPETRERPSFGSLSVYLTRPFLVPNTAGYLFGMAYGTIFTFLPVYLLAVGKKSIGVFVFIYALTVIADAGAGPPAPRPAAPRADVAGRPAPAGRGEPADPLRRGRAGLAAVGAAAGGGHGPPLPRPVRPGARPRRERLRRGWRWRCSPGPSTWGW